LAKFAGPVQNLPIKICREINQNPYLGQAGNAAMVMVERRSSVQARRKEVLQDFGRSLRCDREASP
jgi:hypothetical protein